MSDKDKRINRLEQVLQAFIDIDKYFNKADTLTEYITFVHQCLAKLMDVNNFYLALYNPIEQNVKYLYEVNEMNPKVDPEQSFALTSVEQSPLAYVIINKQKLVIMADNPLYSFSHNPRSQCWSGVPLLSQNGSCLGAIVMQSYDASYQYNEEDQNIFNVISSVLATAIEKHDQVRSLESTLSKRNERLEKELFEKKHAEKSQHALFKITDLKHGEVSLSSLYQKVHEIIQDLIYARNFCILLYNDDSTELIVSYFVDERDGDKLQGTSVPIGKGMSSYVMQTRKPQLLSPSMVQALIESGEIKDAIGCDQFVSWLGVPLVSANMVHGLIIVQSYDEKIIYNEKDLNVLAFFTQHVASAIESTINIQQRRESQIKLAKNHRMLEQQNIKLTAAYQKLQSTQDELIQKEKMASLGGLVAGIAHEINTPLGICVTGVSHFMEETKYIKTAMEDGSLTEKKLVDFIDDLDEIGKILTANTSRAASLIQSFKQIAVDQSSDEIREFNMLTYLEEIILSLRPTLKRTKHQIDIECDAKLWATTHAGAISQIISNLILNSIKHGFELIEEGKILIKVSTSAKSITLIYSDNGCGLSQEDMNRLFDPFFTTKRGEGGSGLGTHLIFNLVSSSLHGKVRAVSEIDKGLSYIIRFPKTI